MDIFHTFFFGLNYIQIGISKINEIKFSLLKIVDKSSDKKSNETQFVHIGTGRNLTRD